MGFNQGYGMDQYQQGGFGGGYDPSMQGGFGQQPGWYGQPMGQQPMGQQAARTPSVTSRSTLAKDTGKFHIKLSTAEELAIRDDAEVWTTSGLMLGYVGCAIIVFLYRWFTGYQVTSKINVTTRNNQI